MEFVLIDKPVGTTPMEVAKQLIDMTKKLMAKPGEFVSGGKMVAAYAAVSEQAFFCIWDVPNAEALAPLLHQLSMFYWKTEVIPVEKTEVAMANLEKAMQAMGL